VEEEMMADIDKSSTKPKRLEMVWMRTTITERRHSPDGTEWLA
jgi:hypothetical protein